MRPTRSHEDISTDADPSETANRIIAVGAGRGGVGKSLVAVNLAVYLAQLGRSVVLVDADAGGSNLHAHFGLKAARVEPSLGEGDPQGLSAALVATSVPGLALLPAAHDAVSQGAPLRARRKMRWLAALRSLPAEYVVVDVGPGHGEPGLDLMLAADIPIAVTVPEPPAIETTYRFLRVAFRRRLRRCFLRDKLRASLVDRALVEMGALPAPIDLVRKLAKVDRALAEIAWAEAQANAGAAGRQPDARAHGLELGAWMSGLVSRHYGVALDELGHIEHDDTVWLTVRRNKPLLVDSPASKSGAQRGANRATRPRARHVEGRASDHDAGLRLPEDARRSTPCSA
jgi:flagellar biosynthesis protein FlhG